ncbi:MBL fold metallo-hydrolase [Sungkyunkwania multivorans]|uniref:MBL fold metallo-hydrolase n=1 Tax=Sungkyunkwania multivorans TaxID=1173618 RepID=A0ABW3CYC0_9FLAO
MKILKKILKRILLTIGSLTILLVIGYIVFVNFYPAFGGDVSDKLKATYEGSDNFRDGIFVNKKEVPEDHSFLETLQIARKFFFTEVPNGIPNENIEVQKVDSANVADYQGKTRLIWFGHSTFLLQMEGKTILIDPMFGEVPAPHPWLGNERFSEKLPIEVEKLPSIDAVILSHDHYDHLDHKTILKLKDKVSRFYTPLAVGVHLKAWGVEESRIVELDWWDIVNFGGLQFICTPAQHFSGRKLNNRQSTLWSSWVIRSVSESIFFSGDSGYGPHFKEIGDVYGPFDLAMLECGQYNESWPDVHMFPEETAQAGIDLRAKKIMPIHWGAFKLALHAWTDPVERVTKKANELQIPITIPEIGEPIFLKEDSSENNWWWRKE